MRRFEVLSRICSNVFLSVRDSISVEYLNRFCMIVDSLRVAQMAHLRRSQFLAYTSRVRVKDGTMNKVVFSIDCFRELLCCKSGFVVTDVSGIVKRGLDLVREKKL